MIAQLFALAIAGAMPAYDIPRVCKGVDSLEVLNPATAYQHCINDERSAQETLTSVWPNIPVAIRVNAWRRLKPLRRVT